MAQAAAAPCPAGTATPQPGRRPRGRPRIRTELELEQRRKAWYRQRYLRSVYLGRQSERWRRVRQQLGHGKDEQTARALLDSFTERNRSGCSVKPCPLDKLGRLHTSCDALRLLVIWAHDHGQECGSIPGLRSVDPDRALWSCGSGHSYCWQLVAPSDEVAEGEVSPSHEDKSQHPEQEGEARRPRRTLAPPVVDGRRPRTRTDRLGAGPRAEEQEDEVRRVTGAQEEEGGRPETPTAPGPRTPNGGGSGGPAVDERGSSDLLQLVCESDSEEQQTGTAAEEQRPAVQQQRQPIAETELLLTSENDCEEDEEEMSEVDSEDVYEFFDDPKDENYIPSSDSGSDRGKRRGRTRRNSVRKPPEDLTERRPPRRRQEQPHPLERPKKIRKKIPKEYVRCEFEGCGKIVSNPQYLKRHMKYQHQLQRTFACSHPSCGRIFRFKTQMEEHEKLHSDQRNYICEFCGRAFKTDKNLVVHRRIHTGEKPLQCEICGFTCRQKASLNWHMRKHDAESGYQFPCDVCGKRFEKKDNVNAHKSKSHPETPPAPSGTAPGAETPDLKPEPSAGTPLV